MPWRGKHPAGYEDFDQALDDSVVYDDFEEESGGWVKPSSGGLFMNPFPVSFSEL